MARPKRITEPIVGAGKDPENKLTVQKSRPLFSLWQSDMTLAEFKILDTYLSRIDSRRPDKRTVIFAKGELEQLLGVTKISKVDLSKRLNNLGRFVEIEKDSSKKSHKVALFEEAYGEMDDNGLWQIRLTCTAPAMKYIFNIEELGYLRYKLRCITSLTSRYTYILFTYLEVNRYRKTWDVSVDELRRMLNCDTEATYAEFKRFNDLVLKKCQKELHDKTECRFSYAPIKTGRKVTAVRFTVETIEDLIQQPDPDSIPGQLSLDDIEPSMHEDHINFLSGACNNEFSPEEMEEIWTIICDKDLPADPQGVAFAQYHCLARVYAKLNVEAARRKIAYRHKYYLSILRSDLAKG